MVEDPGLELATISTGALFFPKLRADELLSLTWT